MTNALADYVSPDPAGLLARAAQEINNHNEEEAMKRTSTDIDRTFEASATSCLAQAKTPAERDHAVAITDEIGKQFRDYKP